MRRKKSMQCIQRLWTMLLLTLSSSVALAQVAEYQGQTASGAYYQIAIPASWQPHNGLVIWNHGYQGYATTELDQSPSLGPLADQVLAQGFALAASSYSQTGWAVFSSHIDNQQLYQRFVELAGAPEQVFIQGASLGGMVTVRDLEAGLIPNVEGALLMCSASAGSRNWYNAFDLRGIYRTVCQDEGNADLPTDSWYEIPDLITGEFQFLRSLERCTGLISLKLFDKAFVSLLQSREQRQRLEKILDLSGLEVEFLPLVLGYAVFELPRLVAEAGKLNGIRPFSNTGVDYGDPIVNHSIKRLAALPSARQTLLDNYTPTGAIGDTQVIAIHTSRDGLVSVANQQYLARRIATDQISTAVVVEDEPSHCGFNYPEGLAAWESLLSWVDQDKQPTATDIQEKCMQLATFTDECRFDPNFTSDADPVRFPRENQLSDTGSILFYENTGLLTVEDLQIIGEPPTYDLNLQLNPTDGERFDVTTVDVSGSASEWAPGARYFTDESLLYLPSLQVLPPRPGSNLFDVYLEYATDGRQQWLRLLEYEQIP